MNKPIPITILITLAVTITAGATIAAAQSGVLDFVLNPNTNVPLINGTIVNNDNKTYTILITPFNGTTPTPTPEPIPTPEKQPPVITVTSPINTEVNKTVVINATVTDPDGNITQIIWNQESGEIVNFTSNGSILQFVPIEADTYVFSIEAQDNDNQTTLKAVTVIAKAGAPIPIPEPIPTPTTIKVIMVGDVEDSTAGTAVFNQIKTRNASIIAVLGDLGYQSNLAWFKSTYGTFGNKLLCVIGNHDAPEDGSSSIYAEALAYCGNDYYVKKLGNTVLFGINTNGDLVKQLTGVKTLVTNADFMNGIKSVHILSHKPCAVPPNAHHPVESKVKTFCDGVKSSVPNTVKVFYDQAHNHVLSASADGTYKTSGAGGKSHYTCGTSTAFPFCNNVKFGFLEYTIKADGTTTSQFLDYNGGVIN